MRYKSSLSRVLQGFLFVLLCLLTSTAQAQNVKRIVIVKIDGLPNYLVDRFVKQRDPATGKSVLPWIDEVFYKNGTRLDNFYVRGMSLSGPSWAILDTGQHLQIKGNVEYDRYTLHQYDYLNFLPLQINYGLKKQIDMPGVEVLDQLKVPLLSDAFDYDKRYTSFQLIQRGSTWKVLGNGFVKFLPKNAEEFMDEWTMGLDLRNVTVNQNERDIIYKLNNRPEMNYFDYFSGAFDHVSHYNRDIASRLQTIREVDRTIGRIWMGIQSSPRADETALVLISDHGFNSEEKTYSQGFNIVKMLASAPGGGHHVVTKRRLMLDYSLKGVYPLIPLFTTTSNESYYLKGQSTDYPTALVDFDGNERSAFHLRNDNLNILQMLFQQLQKGKLALNVKQAAANSFFGVINRNRAKWQAEISALNEEIGALHRRIESEQRIIAAQPRKFTPEESKTGKEDEATRRIVQTDNAVKEEKDYREYIRVINNLLSLAAGNFDAEKLKIEDYIPKGVMGDRNSVFQLQNYSAGISSQGLTPDSGNEIDFEKSFKRVNYFELLENQSVRNNVQPEVSNRPVDFVTTRVPLEAISPDLSPDQKPDESPIWIYGGADKQALIITRKDEAGNQILKYLPIAGLRQDADGKFSSEIKKWSAGFPLKIFEDENLDIPAGTDKSAWLDDWHTETEWIRATHKTLYSIGVVGLNEQLDDHPFVYSENMSPDETLIFRFRQRQRALTEADLLVLANNHWNFDVRGFNPGGNHGSFFRVSTNSTFMIAGGAKTEIPRGLKIEEPYESLSFAPTILKLMGKVNDKGEPNSELYRLGFRKFPGRIVGELFQPQAAVK
ncbi:MAG: sulfatase-like hydrolase/transferase [Pyrinomonadaceae bacterium]